VDTILPEPSRSVEPVNHSRLLHLLRAPRDRWLKATALVDQAIVSATSILTVVILARLAGGEQLGLYSLGMTAVFLTLAIQESLISAPYMVFINLKGLQGSALRRYTGSALTQSVVLGLLASGILAIGGIIGASLGLAAASEIAFVLSGAVLFVLLRELARRDCLARSRMTLLLLRWPSPYGLWSYMPTSVLIEGRCGSIATGRGFLVGGCFGAAWPLS